MQKLRLFRRGALALFAAAGMTGAGTTWHAPSQYLVPAVRSPADAIEVTNRDISASNEKVRMAHAALVTMWSRYFHDAGATFATPDLVRYRGGAPSACGMMHRNNAGYCPNDNTIYFDEVFVAGQAKAAARELGTDGDMAAVGIIAHEMGHAVALQLGVRLRTTYANEAVADCLAGAFAEQAGRDGSLEAGDIDEAFFGMAAAGDPTPRLTGDSRRDQRVLRLISLNSHGTRQQRIANFDRGLSGGPSACLDELRS
jgi:predicted metalloprotease